MKPLYFFLVSTQIMSGAYASETDLQYKDIEVLVMKKNLHVNAAIEATNATKHREGYLLRSWIPKATVEAGFESFQKEVDPSGAQPFGGVRAEVNLFNGTRDWIENRARKIESEVSSSQTSQTLREELLKTQSEFWQIVHLQELTTLLKKQYERNQKNLQASQRRISAGSATESDRMEFEMNKRLLEQDQARIQVELNTAMQNLSVLLGRNPEEPLTITQALPKDVEMLSEGLNLNTSSLAEVKAAQASSELARLKRNQNQFWWLPRVDAYAGFNQFNQRESSEFRFRDRQEYYAGVKLSVPLFDGGESIAEGRAQAALATSYESKALQSLREISVEFENSKSNLKQLAEQVKAASKDVELSEKFLSRILLEYSRGVRNSSEVLSAADRSFNFQKRYSELRRDYQIAKAKIIALSPHNKEKL